MARPHFVHAEWSEKCTECGVVIPQNELIMPIYLRCSGYDRMKFTRVVYCEPCGKLYLESQER
jgi:hypothetical protein